MAQSSLNPQQPAFIINLIINLEKGLFGIETFDVGAEIFTTCYTCETNSLKVF